MNKEKTIIEEIVPEDPILDSPVLYVTDDPYDDSTALPKLAKKAMLEDRKIKRYNEELVRKTLEFANGELHRPLNGYSLCAVSSPLSNLVACIAIFNNKEGVLVYRDTIDYDEVKTMSLNQENVKRLGNRPSLTTTLHGDFYTPSEEDDQEYESISHLSITLK